MTFEESFRLIAEPLDLNEFEVQMQLQNPLVHELVQQIVATQKARTQMAHFFTEKFKNIQAEFLLLE